MIFTSLWDMPQWLAGISFLFLGIILFNAMLLLAFCVIPYTAQGEASPPKSLVGRRLAKGALLLVPGAFDMRRGSPWRGYIAFTLFASALLPGLAQFVQLSEDAGPGPGILSTFAGPNIAKAYPLPTPHSLPDWTAVASYHYWTFFWAYPYVKIFWASVGLAALISLAFHFTRFRRIWHLYN